MTVRAHDHYAMKIHGSLRVVCMREEIASERQNVHLWICFSDQHTENSQNEPTHDDS